MNYLPNETLFNISLLLFLVVIILAFAGLLTMIYRFLSKWITFLQREDMAGTEKIKNDAVVSAQKMLDDAREKSTSIVSEATERAQRTLLSMEKLSQESKNKLTTELESLAENQASALKEASSSLMSFYKESLSKQREESLHTLEDTSHEIEEELLHEVEDFKKVLHDETVGAQQAVEAKVQEKYAVVEKEITSYREKQLKAVDETIYDILHDVSKKVFGEALDMEDHQDLVIKALAEAKENNVL